MPVRVYKCSRCSKVTQIEWVGGMQPKCPCGSTQLQRITLQSLAPTTPAIPQAPPIGGLKLPTSPPKVGGPSLLDGIKASKVGQLDAATGARHVNRDAMDRQAYDRYWGQAKDSLPPNAVVAARTQEEVNTFVRCVVNGCKVTSLPNRQIDLFFGGRKYLLKSRVTVDLTLPLAEMAAGKCRPAEHGNANSAFGNMGGILPRWVGSERVTYLEFGWLLRVPPSLRKISRSRDGRDIPYVEVTDEDGRDVDFGVKTAIARRIANDGGKLEAGLRLVISSWGYLFFSNTHYRSFLIYDPMNEAWKAYGAAKTADISWYDKGAGHSDWILPVSAPGYW